MMKNRRKKKRDDADIRVEILRNAGQYDRQLEWNGRAQFLYDVHRVESLEGILECAERLNEAKFDEWHPDMKLACPCCVKRTIASSLSKNKMLEKLSDYIHEFGQLKGIEDDDTLAHVLWHEFSNVDCTASGKGFCSLTKSCECGSRKHEPWSKEHKHFCVERPNFKGYFIDKVMPENHDCLSRIQFAEGLSQVLGLEMEWLALRCIVDEMASPTQRDRITFETFYAKLIKRQFQMAPSKAEFEKVVMDVCRFIEIADLSARETFLYFDREKTGMVSATDLKAFFRKVGIAPSKACMKRLVETYNEDSCTWSKQQFTEMLTDFFILRTRWLEMECLQSTTNSVKRKQLTASIRQAEVFLQTCYNWTRQNFTI